VLIAIISGFLGVPLWLIVGLLVFTFWTRHRFKKMEGVFPFKGCVESGSAPGFGTKYPGQSSYGRWVHNVFLVHKGLALVHTIPIGVKEAIGQPVIAGGEKVKRMGEQPVLLRFRLDSGAVVRLVVRAEAIDVAMGPFLPGKEISLMSRELKSREQPV
jgi:hypothetical protein